MNQRCTNNELCEITPLTRNSCQHCRLKKCFTVGMSRGGQFANIFIPVLSFYKFILYKTNMFIRTFNLQSMHDVNDSGYIQCDNFDLLLHYNVINYYWYWA